MSVEEETYAACLAALPGMGPVRLSEFLNESRPSDAWHELSLNSRPTRSFPALNDAQSPKLWRLWRRAASAVDLVRAQAQYKAANVRILLRGRTMPTAFADDLAAPAVLFAKGRRVEAFVSGEVLSSPTVALIGTRKCSWEGRDIARKFGAELAERGVVVVSGLAAGIDGAAHEGALSAPGGAAPLAVVGSGLDVVYPRRNARLWKSLEDSGVIVSEAPLGSAPEAWRFPARNRLIAAASDLVVVIESHARGGSLLTVDEAAQRDVQVLAVPGSIRNPAAEGSNTLLRDGCGPASCIDDLLVALPMMSPGDQESKQVPVPPGGLDGRVLKSIDWAPTTVDDVLLRSRESLGEVSMALLRLEAAGWISGDGGRWRRSEGCQTG